MAAIPLPARLVVRAVRDRPALPQAVDDEVGRIWQSACARDPRLFNGTVFSADRILVADGVGRVEGHWSEFRRVLAQMREPRLFDALGLRPLAVCGWLRCADGLVLGRREAGAAYQPGGWQGVPAGSVERREADEAAGIDLVAQLLAECAEELGLDADEVQVEAALLAFEHAQSHVVDLCLALSTDFGFAAVEQRWRERGNREYDRLALAATLLPDGVSTAPAALLPTTLALLAAGDRPA